MKNLLAFVAIFFCAQVLSAQDNVILNSGDEFEAKILEITTNGIKYKKWNNQEGPTYTIAKEEIFKITYQNGSYDIFNKTATSSGSKSDSFERIAQTPLNTTSSQMNSMRGWATSINPLGFLQFGPMINVEYGITDNLVLNAHYRHPPFGLLTHIMHDNYSYLDGVAVGAGVSHFWGQGQNKFYLGGFYQYHKSEAYESYKTFDRSTVNILGTNVGYRFRFDNGLFVNTGALLGAGLDNYYWRDEDYSGSGTEVVLFGMLELSIGYQF